MGGPSLDLCRALLALRDPALGGRLAIENVPPLITLLRFWKVCLIDHLPNTPNTKFFFSNIDRI